MKMPELLPAANTQQWLKLLADTAAYLLLADNPQTLVQALVARLAPQLRIDVCFYYLVEEGSPRMRLEFFQGVPPEIAEALSSLEFDHPLCRRIVSAGHRLVLEDIVQSAAPDVELVRCLGMTAYACYPLLAYGGLLGMLGFGSRFRPSFEADELELLQTISFQLAAAMERLRMIAILQQRNKALQAEVAERQQADVMRNRLATVVESSEDAIVAKTLDGIVTAWNQGAERIFGYTPEEIIGRPITILIPPERHEEETAILARLRKGERIEHYETIRLCKDGRRLDISLTVSPIKDSFGKIIGASKIARDITESKRAREAIRASLAEKEVLLKEVHHRVKNNMQIISSLLSLQAGSIEDPRVADLFEASQNRIRSMALVHERLYGTEDLSRVEIGSYIRSLANDIITSHGANVAVDVEADEIVFGLDVAIPCGLMLNELIVNAVKHAFPNGRKGSLRITLSRQEDQRYLLTIQDDGIGLPPGVTPATTASLGMRLVKTLAGQLHGTVEIERKNGTIVTIRFSADRAGQA